jgi:hypothetical protein
VKPANPISYAFLMLNDISLNRLDEAKAAYWQGLERKVKSLLFRLALYQIAFVQNDAVGMTRQVSESEGQGK